MKPLLTLPRKKKNGEKGRKNKWIAVDQFNLITTERSSTSQWIRVSLTYLEKRKWKGIQHQKNWDVPHEKQNGGNDICSRSNALLYGKRLRLSLYPHLINDLDWFSQRHFLCVCAGQLKGEAPF